jgi:hypothetical protein
LSVLGLISLFFCLLLDFQAGGLTARRGGGRFGGVFWVYFPKKTCIPIDFIVYSRGRC